MPLACNTCRLAFENPEAHRNHCKTDWHKYNLKRKIVDLPVVTFEVYEQRELASIRQVCETVFSCKQSHKNFSSENALSSRINSKRHFDVISKKQTSLAEHITIVKNPRVSNPKSQSGSEPGIQGKTVSPPQTLDLWKESDGEIAEEEDDDVDWESVNSDDDEMPPVPTNICLFCCYESKTTEENLKHMKISHSFSIPDAEYVTDLDGLICYLGQKVAFGFTCLKCDRQKHSLCSVQQHMIDKGHCYMQFEGDAQLEYEDYYDYSASYPEGRQNADEAVNINVLEADVDGYSMRLPSGATVWHRAYTVYCHQNLPPKRAVALRTNKVVQGFHALCQSGDLGKGPFYKTNAYKCEFAETKALKLGMKHNKFQPHFRSQVMF